MEKNHYRMGSEKRAKEMQKRGGRGGHLRLAQRLHAFEGLRVGDADVFGTARVLEPRVLRAHARVVQARRDAVRLLDLAVLVL
jgi:hypothetical protein